MLHDFLACEEHISEDVIHGLLLIQRVDEVGAADVAAEVLVARSELNDDGRAWHIGERIGAGLRRRLQIKLLAQ